MRLAWQDPAQVGSIDQYGLNHSGQWASGNSRSSFAGAASGIRSLLSFEFWTWPEPGRVVPFVSQPHGMKGRVSVQVPRVVVGVQQVEVLRDLDLQPYYRSDRHRLLSDFYEPCLMRACLQVGPLPLVCGD